MIIYDPIITGSFQLNGSTLNSVGEIDTLSGSVSALNSVSSSYLLNTTDTLTGNLTVTGTLTAQEFHTEYTSASIVYQSGSTKFGDSADDTHVFTGRITQNDGNLGIGTVATTAHIHEASTGVANLRLTELGAGGSAQIYLENTVETFELGADASPQGFYIRALNDPNGYGQGTFFINASGSIGIGTTSPLSRLHITNTGGADNIPLIGFGEDGSNEFGFRGHFLGTGETGNSFEFYSNWASNILRFLGNGNVGVGTNSPAKKLDVYNGDIQIHNTTPYLTFRNTVGGTHTIRRENDSLIIREGSPITGDRLTIQSGGYVGIGTDSPETNLEVHGILQVTNDPTLDYARLGTNTLGGYVQGYGGGVENFLIRSYASSGVQAYFNAGYIGLGTTSPGTALHISQTAPILGFTDTNSFTDTNDRFQIRAGSNEGLIQWWDNSAGTTITHMTFESDGNVGVGTTSAITGFHVNSRVLIGDTYVAPSGTSFSTSNAQLILGGTHNTGPNNDNPGVKLLITGHNNDGGDIYPIYVEDENGLLDFYLKGRTSGAGTPTAVFGGSISFNGDTAAANQLDDYEEGTWTPNYYGDSTAGTVTYAGRGGTYTKIGNQVTAWFSILNFSVTGAAGNLIIGGLPFTPNFTNSVRGAFSGNIRTYNVDWPDGYSNILINLGNGDSYMSVMMIRDNGTWANLQVENGSNQYIEGYVTYTV